MMLARYLAPQRILGLAWGTSISATVDAFDAKESMPVKVVQLVGAMGAHNMEYDGHDLVARITEKLGGEAYYLNAPYLCQSAEMARSLLDTNSICETISVGKKTDIALLGIGTTSPDYSSFYLAGYVTRRELEICERPGRSAMCAAYTLILMVNLLAMIFVNGWCLFAGPTCYPFQCDWAWRVVREKRMRYSARYEAST